MSLAYLYIYFSEMFKSNLNKINVIVFCKENYILRPIFNFHHMKSNVKVIRTTIHTLLFIVLFS